MASTTMQRRQWVALVIATATSVLTVGCEEHWAEPHSSGTRISIVRPECPQTFDTIPLFPVGRKATGEAGTVLVPATPGPGEVVLGSSALAVSGPLTDIPEFNDCQKFVIPGVAGVPAHYDSLYAIFAAFKLDSLTNALIADTVTWSSSNSVVATVSAGGVVTGVSVGTATIIATSTSDSTRKAAMALLVNLTAPPVTPVPVSITNTAAESVHVGNSFPVVATIGPPTTSSLPAAEIYTYGPGDTTLGIGPNFSCLYLYFKSNGHLTAKMVQVPTLGPSQKACFGAVNPVTASGKTLSVIRTGGFKASDYPAVARWDWDPVNKHQYVGIKCGSAWCEIGAPGHRPFTTSGPYSSPSGTSAAVARVVGIKGWYDEQFLAVPGAGHMIPSGAKGTVIPDPKLYERRKSDFSGGWVPVAHVAVALDPAEGAGSAGNYYKQKFNFDPVPVQPSLTGMNTLSLCYGTRDHCNVPMPTPPAVGCGPETKPPFIWWIRRWWAKVESASHDKTMYRCVTRREHPAATSMGIQFAATTRWRWLANDETTWNYCEVAGCCESNGDAVSRGWQ